jgi:hypothetical protein
MNYQFWNPTQINVTQSVEKTIDRSLDLQIHYTYIDTSRSNHPTSIK